MFIKSLNKLFTWPVMAVSNLLYLLIALLLCSPLRAQHTAVTPVPRATLHLSGRYTLSQLTAEAYRQTGIGFSFDAKKIKNQQSLLFTNKSYTLQQVLQQIQQTTGLQYAVYTGHIILHNAPATPQQPVAKKQAPTSSKRKDTTALPRFITLPASYAQVAATAPAYPPVVHTADSMRAKLLSLPAAPGPLPAQTRQQAPPAPEPDAPERNRSTLHLQAGIFATDAMYTNAGIEAGASWLHLLASVGANAWVREWRLGIGTIVKRTSKSDFQANASIGFMQKSYQADSLSLPRTITVKGKLASLQLEWHYFFNNRLSAKLAVNYNALFSTYYINGQKGILPFDVRKTGDETFRLVKPWKLLSNTYAPETPSNIKQWAGACIGIYYNLNFFRRR